MKTTGFKFLLAMAMLAAAISQNAFADKGVFQPKVTPNEIFAGEDVTLTFSAEVGAGNLYISSVALYETTEAGKPLRNLGTLHDDGLNGDAREADTIFSLQVPMNASESSERYFVITAAYQGERMRYRSAPIKLSSVVRVPIEVLQHEIAIAPAIKQQFLTDVAAGSETDAMQKALQSALQNPDVKSAILSDFTLSIITKSGVKSMVILRDPNTPSDGAGKSVPQNPPANMKNPGNDKVLIYAPGYSNAEDTQNQIANSAKSIFSNGEYMSFNPDPMAITADGTASLELVKHWGDYGTVIIHTHGGVWTDPETKVEQVSMLTGTFTNPDNVNLYVMDLLQGHVGTEDDGQFYFLPSYITQHATNMSNTFFYLGACDSLANDSLWNALRAKGAKVALGWNESVSRTFNAEKFTEIAQFMLPDDSTTDPKTVAEAYNAVDDKIDGWCPFGYCVTGTGAQLQLRTASPEWANFTLVEGGLVNGDFETGDWTGWTHGGDYNYRLISGAHQHQGASSAALGRWDTSFHGHDETAEPYGFEWFYQDFTVPNNVTTLSFYWWMETYDTAVWDWFDAYIQDTDGNVLKNLVVQGGKPGTDYGPYWSTSGWQYVSVDISAYRGQKIRIYFDQRLDGYGDQQRVYVDDVKLQ